MTPTENDTTSRRVNRGGSWHSFGASWVRAASRNAIEPANRNFNFGFRTTLTARQPR